MLDKEYLREIARLIDSKLPDNHGFILLTFPFGNDTDSRITYTAKGRREDCIAALKEFLITVSGPEEWLKHIK